MKVKELRRQLEALDPETEILFKESEWDEDGKIKRIELAIGKIYLSGTKEATILFIDG